MELQFINSFISGRFLSKNKRSLQSLGATQDRPPVPRFAAPVFIVAQDRYVQSLWTMIEGLDQGEMRAIARDGSSRLRRDL